MEIARVGNHELTACPCCGRLFDVKIEGDNRDDSIYALTELLHQHRAECPAYAAHMDSLPTIDDFLARVRPAMEAAETERRNRAADNPHNGTLGYWLVTGVRNEARTRATSATEAIMKCRDVVQSWESPEAEWIGIELPDVF